MACKMKCFDYNTYDVIRNCGPLMAHQNSIRTSNMSGHWVPQLPRVWSYWKSFLYVLDKFITIDISMSFHLGTKIIISMNYITFCTNLNSSSCASL